MKVFLYMMKKLLFYLKKENITNLEERKKELSIKNYTTV